MLWLYPHLLKALGLLALGFACLSVRSTEGEAPSTGYLRGGLVFLGLLIAGAWSLRSQLPVGWTRLVPTYLTSLYLAFALALWVTPTTSKSDHSMTAGRRALAHLPTIAVLCGFLVLLGLAASQASSSPNLPNPSLIAVLAAGTLALAPLGTVWLLSRELSESVGLADQLAFVAAPKRSVAPPLPSPRFFTLSPLVAFVVAAAALSSLQVDAGHPHSFTALFVAFGTIVGGLIVLGLLGLVERSAALGIADIRLLIQESRLGGDSAFNFEAAILLCARAISRSDLTWLLLALMPAVSMLALQPFLAATEIQSFALGLAIGAATTGAGAELLQNTLPHPARRSLAQLALCIGLSQTLWLLATSHFHT
jgi:hypothetical protein